MSARILIVAEHDGGKLNPSTAKCVSCARALSGAEITIAVCAADPGAVAAQAAQLAGVNRVLTVDNPANRQPLAAVLAPQIAALGVEPRQQLKLVRFEPPPQRQKGIRVKDAAELVDALRRKGLL